MLRWSSRKSDKTEEVYERVWRSWRSNYFPWTMKKRFVSWSLQGSFSYNLLQEGSRVSFIIFSRRTDSTIFNVFSWCLVVWQFVKLRSRHVKLTMTFSLIHKFSQRFISKPLATKVMSNICVENKLTAYRWHHEKRHNNIINMKLQHCKQKTNIWKINNSLYLIGCLHCPISVNVDRWFRLQAFSWLFATFNSLYQDYYRLLWCRIFQFQPL